MLRMGTTSAKLWLLTLAALMLMGHLANACFPTKPPPPPPGSCANSLIVPANADPIIYHRGNFAVYSCKSGFILQGDKLRPCQNGIWAGTDPTCEKRCPLIPLDNGHVAYEYDDGQNAREIGSKAYFTCDADFRTTYTPPDGDNFKTCSENCEWSGPEVECVRSMCPVLTIENGVVTHPRRTNNGVATYSCDEGFRREGVEMRTCGRSEGFAWDEDAPTCTKTCPEFGVGELNGATPDYGQNGDGEERGIGSVATFTCTDGEAVQSDGERTCMGDLEWSGNAVVCAAKCPVLDAPTNGVVTYGTRDANDVATYTCMLPAVQQEGEATPTLRTCQAGLTWDGEPITCAELCPMLSITNGYIDYTDPSRMPPVIATYKCNKGYAFQGKEDQRTCAEYDVNTFTWDMDPSADVDWRCDLVCPPIVDTATWTVVIVPESRAAMSVATHTCTTEGHVVTTGDATRTCLAGLTWSGTEPTCAPPL